MKQYDYDMIVTYHNHYCSIFTISVAERTLHQIILQYRVILDTVQSTVQDSTVQYSPVQSSPVEHATVDCTVYDNV